jgi:hypothetical protein
MIVEIYAADGKLLGRGMYPSDSPLCVIAQKTGVATYCKVDDRTIDLLTSIAVVVGETVSLRIVEIDL